MANSYPVLIGLWLIMGFGYSLTITPAGRALRRSSTAQDRPALFALSHACWLIAYPVAGLVSAEADPAAAFLVLAALCATGALLGLLIWPASDPEILAHSHPELEPDDPHLTDGAGGATVVAHAHPFVIDEKHDRWPRPGGWGRTPLCLSRQGRCRIGGVLR